MPWSIAEILLALPAFALVLFRLSGLFITAPIFGSTMIPMRIRAALAATLAAMIFPIVGGQAPERITLAGALVGGAGEMMIGAAIGLSLSIFVIGAEVAGLMVGRQAGLALSEIIDPTMNEKRSVVGQLYSITMVLVFLVAGGHRATLAALLDTYEVIPLLSFEFNDTIILLLTQMLGAAFMFGVRLAGPVLIALFMSATALSFLSRTMPQLNIMTVGFPVRIFVALTVAGLVLSSCQDLLINAVWDALETVREAFGLDPYPKGLVI